MALSKDVSLFQNQVTLTGAYHKIVRLRFNAEGSEIPKITGLVNVYKDQAAADANATPLEQIPFEFSDDENAVADVDAFRAFLYNVLKTRDRFAGAVDV